MQNNRYNDWEGGDNKNTHLERLSSGGVRAIITVWDEKWLRYPETSHLILHNWQKGSETLLFSVMLVWDTILNLLCSSSQDFKRQNCTFDVYFTDNEKMLFEQCNSILLMMNKQYMWWIYVFLCPGGTRRCDVFFCPMIRGTLPPLPHQHCLTPCCATIIDSAFILLMKPVWWVRGW